MSNSSSFASSCGSRFHCTEPSTFHQDLDEVRYSILCLHVPRFRVAIADALFSDRIQFGNGAIDWRFTENMIDYMPVCAVQFCVESLPRYRYMHQGRISTTGFMDDFGDLIAWI